MAETRPSLFSTGRWTGTYAVLSLERQLVARLLDPALRLGPAPAWTAAGEHPLYFMLGRQSDVSGAWPVMRSFGVTYHEAMILIPYVRFAEGHRDFLFMPRLYLNAAWPTALGVHVFGFAKVQK